MRKPAQLPRFPIAQILIPGLIFFLLLISNFYFWQKSQRLESQLIVEKVIDGDTFILSSGQRLRLSNLEAPELNFCGGQEAKQALEKLILNKKIEYDIISLGVFNIPLALVYIDDTLVNEAILKQGWARYDGTPNPKREVIKTAYDEALENRRGIFSPLCFSEKPKDPRCLIKGNTNRHSHEKTYHFPGCSGYQQTMVEKDLGEDWFCTEKEAQKAGFKKSANCFGKTFKP